MTSLANKKTVGVILAGGQSSRMGFQDKGLLLYRQKPLISYPIHALAPVVDQLLVNANRHLQQYRQFGFPVVPDLSQSFDGPLAGIAAVMNYTDAEVLVVMPCDCPLLKTAHIIKLLHSQDTQQADIAVAFDGYQQHNAFMVINMALQQNLQNYLSNNQRKVGGWLAQNQTIRVDFSTEPEIFANINSPEDLGIMENQTA